MSLTWPVDVAVSQQFGSNPNSIQPNGHTGIDFATPLNTPVRAAGAGTVLWADWANKLSSSNQWWVAPTYAGITVIIDHGNGLLSLYAHLNGTDLNPGDQVAQGQVIGISGSTGLSTGPHLHFEVLGWPLQPYNGYYGRLNPNDHVAAAVAIEPNQREVGQYGVTERAAASSGSEALRKFVAGDVLTFKGFVRGEEVYGTNVWFVGAFAGTYFSASAFDDSSTHDLPDLTPAPPAPAPEPDPVLLPTQRVVGSETANYREAPSISANIAGTFKRGDVLNFSAWRRGDSVNGSDVWFKGALTGGYVHSSNFDDGSTTGLNEEIVIEPTPTSPVPTPTPNPLPNPVKYDFVPDFDFVEKIPAAAENVQQAKDHPGVTVFPEKPDHAVIHQFGVLGTSLNSVINTFTNPNLGDKAVSAHFVVSGKRIIQMVSLKDRAYHAYVVGNDYVGIETDPAQDPDTIASTKRLLAALRDKYGYELQTIRHRDVPKCVTSCGSLIDLTNYTLDMPEPEPEPTPTPTPTPVPSPEADEREIVEAFIRWLVERYMSSK